jgi:hypothetical protein
MSEQPHILSIKPSRTASAGPGGDTGWLQRGIEEMTWRQQDELRRMRKLGMQFARKLDLCVTGRLSHDETVLLAKGRGGIIGNLFIVARAVRQIIVLERELAGLRPAPRAAHCETQERPERRCAGPPQTGKAARL